MQLEFACIKSNCHVYERERETDKYYFNILLTACRALASSKSVPLDTAAPKKEVGRKKQRYPMTPQEGMYMLYVEMREILDRSTSRI